MILSVISLLSTVLGVQQPPSVEVEDLSNLPYLNADLSSRQTAKLRLANGLEVLIISDPKADQSAASVAVKAGSWNDPLEYAGMAHFCEHMLFQGTAKYPKENEFFSMVSNYGGLANAFTAANRTVYMFSSQTDGFLAILDRFAHFFIDPLFKPDNIAREMHAVDQEFAKNIEHDGWREYMILKETGNPDHPNQMFSTGNSQTLGKIPQSALKKWHAANYGADRMHLVLYSSLPLQTLKDTAVEFFNAVPLAQEARIDGSAPLTSAEQRGHIIYVKPIQNRRTLTISWELPLYLSDDATKSADIVAYALERGQQNSLYESLKNKQWIDDLSIRVDDFGGKEHRFFSVSLELTQKGLKVVDEVALHCFEAFAGLKESGVPAYFFEEKNAMAQLNYQYQSRFDAFDYISKLGDTVHEEPLESYPRNTLLSADHHAEKMEEVLALLTPDTCIVSLMAPPEETNVLPDRKEKWMGAEYAIRSIPEQWLAAWSAAAPNPEIRLAEENPFVPTHLQAVATEEFGSTPVPLADNELGRAFYVRSPEFAAPEVVYHVHILTPEIDQTARSATLASLYIDHLTDALHPLLAAANNAGLKARFDIDRSRIYLQISGYSEKAPLLLAEIARQMPLNSPTAEQFALYFERHEKEYKNREKELAVSQAKELANSLINQDKIASKEKLAALKTLTFEDFANFHKKLFEQTYVEALFAGNLTLKDAESAWLDITHALSTAPYVKEQHPQTKTLHLPEGAGPYAISQSTEAQGNATLLLLDQGPFSFEARATQEILSSALKEAFFNELRTKQKTGYIAKSDASEIEEHLFQTFLVQSNSHQPEDLLFRFELFLEEFHATLEENVSKDRFKTLKTSLSDSLKNRYRNLKDKSALWDLLAFQKDGDFAFIDKRIAAVEALQYEEFLATSRRFLSRDNRKRLAILFEGKLHSPFAYQEIPITNLKEIATYAPKPEKAASHETVENGE